MLVPHRFFQWNLKVNLASSRVSPVKCVRWFGSRLCLSGLVLLIRPVASLHYSSLPSVRVVCFCCIWATCSIIFAASVNAIFSSSCFPVCVSEHYSTACTRRVYPLIMVANLTCAPFLWRVLLWSCVYRLVWLPACSPSGCAPGTRMARSHSSSVLTLRITETGLHSSEPFALLPSTYKFQFLPVLTNAGHIF